MMKRMKRLAAMALMLLLLTAAFIPPAMADSIYGVIKTPTRDGAVNLRARAGVSQSIVGWAQLFVRLCVLAAPVIMLIFGLS